VGNTYTDNSDYVMGATGVGRIQGWTGVFIKGKENWRYKGPKTDMYQIEHNELFASIRSGQPINDGEWMAHSTLMAIMGRMAAYTGQEITWEQAANSQEKLVPDQLDWKMKLDFPSAAMPGVTKLV
jgi:myo-inositol 2-dehydrogenase/D-chiro-inositol 1-dehydrogenase